MGAWEKLLGFGGAALVLYGISSARKNSKERAEQEEKERKALAREEAKLKKAIATEKRRQNTPFCYPDYLTQEQFEEIAKVSIKPMKKKFANYGVVDGKFYGTVISQSGISEWDFVVDFNDFGKLTGEYWLQSENEDSTIPRRVAETIRYAVCEILAENSSQPYSVVEKVYSKEDNVLITEETDDEEETIQVETPQKPTKPSWASRHKGFIFIAILISIALMFGSYAYYEYQKLIPIGYEEDALVGLEYNKVVEMLENSGFTYVTTEDISDLSLDEESNANLVTDIRLEEKPTFDEDTKYAYDKHIVIVYHSLKLSSAPITSKEAKGTNYTDVVDKFKDSGFINVKTNIIYDIITGWVTDDGEVKSVTINGDEDFDTYGEYRPDAEVVITYHTYKKNDPNK